MGAVRIFTFELFIKTTPETFLINNGFCYMGF
ncbi:unnamed protein product [Dracunculus medinensis]|uniref:Uncharacterized protein n=1 Tax=Dracunculus medinensis TaxID=318479 RepID=A0A0N4UDA2_DRAME|nr:unnamed protein product [Dracunculus medinensis]